MTKFKRTLTIREAMQEASIGRTKLFEAIRKGQLKAKKNGSRTIIMAEDLEDYLISLPDRSTAGEVK